MRIAFFNPLSMAFNVRTPQTQPLGGMASSTCYLARALATRGHDVTLISELPSGTPSELMGVKHVPLKQVQADSAGFFQKGNYDVVIAVNGPDLVLHVKRASPHTVFIVWAHIYPDQPALRPLQQYARFIDAIVCVSKTLRDTFTYDVQTVAIENAISPFFENMFSSADELLAAKKNRAVYASMPFRGLNLVVETMARVGGKVELDVYSSMRTYQEPDKNYPGIVAIYEAARRNPRIRHHGAVGQQSLANAFRSAAYLTYPCIFIETYCIVAQEAIAAGLKVISNDLGALPETTMGFADLLPVQGGKISDEDHIAGITALLEKAEATFQRDPRAWAEERFAQAQEVNRNSTWAVRAAQWESFMAPGIAAIKAALATRRPG